MLHFCFVLAVVFGAAKDLRPEAWLFGENLREPATHTDDWLIPSSTSCRPSKLKTFLTEC